MPEIDDCIIRAYRPEDREAVRGICVANSRSVTPQTEQLLLAMYCDYYLDYEPEHALVLDNGDCPVGYLYFAVDFHRYDAVWRREYLHFVASQSAQRLRAHEDETRLMAELYDRYPAHMHIDILAGYRRRGYGFCLLDRAVGLLKSEGISGLMLTAGATNESAAAFYQRYGFERVGSTADSVAFGLNLRTICD